MKRYIDIVNGNIKCLPKDDTSGAYSIECADEQEYLNSGCPKNLVFENDVIRWKTDDEKEQEAVDAMGAVEKLAVRRAMRAMGEEDKLDTLLDSSDVFKKDWLDCTVVDLNDEVLKQALAQATIDVDAVKRKIIEMRNEATAY